eukprot:754992-Hanusia_phi.AAC.1
MAWARLIPLTTRLGPAAGLFPAGQSDHELNTERARLAPSFLSPTSPPYSPRSPRAPRCSALRPIATAFPGVPGSSSASSYVTAVCRRAESPVPGERRPVCSYRDCPVTAAYCQRLSHDHSPASVSPVGLTATAD